VLELATYMAFARQMGDAALRVLVLHRSARTAVSPSSGSATS